MTEDNFSQVIKHFLVMRISLEPQACLLAATIGTGRTESASQHADGRNGGAERNFRRERWIEVDIAWHEHIYEMSANPFLDLLRVTLPFRLPDLLYLYYLVTTVVKLDLHQAIVDAIDESDGDRGLRCLSGVADSSPIRDYRINRILNQQ